MYLQPGIWLALYPWLRWSSFFTLWHRCQDNEVKGKRLTKYSAEGTSYITEEQHVCVDDRFEEKTSRFFPNPPRLYCQPIVTKQNTPRAKLTWRRAKPSRRLAFGPSIATSPLV